MRLVLLALTLTFMACDDSSTPKDTSSDTTPDTTPGDTTPDDTTPDTTPDDTTPGDTTPDDTTPGDTTPGDTTPGDTTPGDTTPGDTTPDDTTPGDTTPDDTTPDTDTSVNAAPTITEGPAGDVDAGISGDPILLSVTATDTDGDTLSYTWSQVSPTSPQGLFQSANGNKIEYILPEFASATTVTLRVAVSDGVNPPVTADFQIAATIPRFTADILPIFSICTGCHGTSGGMSLTSANAYSNLVNARGNNGSCNTLDRVEPGQPDNSLLVRKISGTSCGSRMPASDPSFFANDPGLITRIRSWILAGALNN